MQHIVLLHGLFANHLTLSGLEGHFKRAGYIVHNWSYYTGPDLKSIGKRINKRLNKTFSQHDKVHFVGHSLGGLAIRSALNNPYKFQLGNIVTIGTPHTGAILVNMLPFRHIFSILCGNVIHEIKYKSKTLRELHVPDTFIGSISGSKGTSSINPISWFTAYLLSEVAHDGIVAIKETKGLHIDDHINIHVSHLSMMYDENVCHQVQHFIENDKFDKD